MSNDPDRFPKFFERNDIKLQWGDPPKPNVWKVEERTRPSTQTDNDTMFLLTSPLIEGVFYILYITDRDKCIVEYWGKNSNRAKYIDKHSYLPLSKVTSHEFYTTYVAPLIADGTIKLTHGGLKLASSNLQAMWGNPPKPNLWKVDVNNIGKLGAIVESPLLKEEDAVFLLRQRSNWSWMIEYNSHFPIGLPEKVRTFTASTKQEALSIFLNEKGWGMIVEWMTNEGNQVFRTKVASSNLKAQWGDPPKPNLWKVDVRRDGEYDGQAQVTSPLLLPQTSITLSRRDGIFPIKGRWHVDFEGDSGFPWEEILDFDAHVSFDRALDFFLSKNGWDQIKSAIDDQRIEAFKTKVASDRGSYTAQWGDPPKPNLWKVKIGQIFNRSYVEITSPLLHETENITLTKANTIEPTWDVSFNPYNAEYHIVKVRASSFEEARDRFLSQEGWSWIKSWMKGSGGNVGGLYGTGSIFNQKVGSGPDYKSSRLRVYWGDPPKPNLWKLFTFQYNKGEKFGEAFVESPLLKKDHKIYLYPNLEGSAGSVDWDGETWLIRYENEHATVDETIHMFKSPEFKQALSFFVSKSGWQVIKNWISITRTEVFLSKVASSNPQAQWGNPPKPNLWKVKEHKDHAYGSYVSVTSPLLDGGELLLTSPAYNGSHQFQIEYADKNDQVFIIKVLGSYPYINALRWFLSSGAWGQISEWASKQPKSIFRTDKIASTNLKAQWGNPPKPSLWKVKEYPNFAGGAFVEVTSPLLGGHHRSLLLTSPEYNSTPYYQIEYTNGNDPEWYNGGYNGVVIVIDHVNSYTKALEYFLSNKYGWKNIKDWASKQEFPIFGKNKVASEE